jgi:hypothetical protein
VEAVCDPPEVFEHVDQVEDDRALHPGLLHRPLHQPKLVAVAVDKDHPAAPALRVAPKPLLERLVDHLLRVRFEARPDALVDGARAPPLHGARASEVVQDVHRRAHPRRDRVHGRHLRHALAVAFLPRRQPRLELVLRPLGRPLGALAQVRVPHDHALAVEAEHEQRRGLLGHCGARRVEGREILRRPYRQILDLALRHRDAEDLRRLLDDAVERNLARLLGDQASYAERVQVDGEVECGVSRKQRLHAMRLVGPAPDLDQADDREQAARPPPMRGPAHTVGATHLDHALARRAEIEVRLQRPPLDLAPLLPNVTLQPRVCVFRSTWPPVPTAPGHPFRRRPSGSERSDGSLDRDRSGATGSWIVGVSPLGEGTLG